MKILTVIGARPQFIKASVVSAAIEKTAGLSEEIIHTGQHFDANMSNIFFKKPCITMRDQTEWVELIENGVNVLAGADTQKIIEYTKAMLNKKIEDPLNLYGGGQASQNIVNVLAGI